MSASFHMPHKALLTSDATKYMDHPPLPRSVQKLHMLAQNINRGNQKATDNASRAGSFISNYNPDYLQLESRASISMKERLFSDESIKSYSRKMAVHTHEGFRGESFKVLVPRKIFTAVDEVEDEQGQVKMTPD
jgi:hypothetical protein